MTSPSHRPLPEAGSATALSETYRAGLGAICMSTRNPHAPHDPLAARKPIPLHSSVIGAAMESKEIVERLNSFNEPPEG
jgi:hypothetical protein